MTDKVVREVALPTGLVDNKVCAIDDTWTGLRLVIRRETPVARRTASSGRYQGPIGVLPDTAERRGRGTVEGMSSNTET